MSEPILSVRGTFFLPVIPLSFANGPLPFPRLTYQRLFFEGDLFVERLDLTSDRLPTNPTRCGSAGTR